MPQPVSNTTDIVSGSLLANKISYVVDGQNRNYRGGFGGLSWMSEAPASNNVIFIGNTTTIGRGPADKPLFYPSFNNTEANIVYAVNTLPGSPGNLTTLAGAYNWATTNNFFINNSDNPIARVNADGMVLFVDGGQPTSYPQTGTSWYDLSGQANTGTLINGTVWNSSGWFDFDGVDDTVRIGSTSILNTPNGFTGESWVRFDTTSAMVLIHKDNVYSLRRSSNTGLQWADGTNWSYSSWGTTTFATGTIQRFYHIAATKNGSTVTLYGNGEVLVSKTFGSSGVGGNTNDLYIGSYAGSSNWMDGNIARTKIHNKALTQTEIKQSLFQSNIVQDGLVFMVDANNLVSYPKSGTTTYSLTGSLTGTLTNGVSYLPNNGGTFDFDGTDDYIAISSNVNYTDVTIEAWIYREKGDLLNIVGGTGIAEYFCVYQGKLAYYASQNTGTWTYGTTTIQAQTWYHVAITMNNSNGETKMYVNGILESTTTAQTGYRSGYVTTIGVYGNTSIRFWDGYIPNVRIYNKALTAGEVQQNYEATKDKFLGSNIITNGLLVYLDAADKNSYPGTGTTWTDLSGNGNNFTLYNSPYFNASGGFFVLDGVDDWIRSANTLNLSGTNAATIVVLFKPNSYPSSGNVDFVFEHTANFNSSTGGFVHTYNDTSLAQSYQVFWSNRGNAGYNIGIWDKSNYNDLNWKQATLVVDRAQSSIENTFYLQGSQIPALSNPAPGYANNNTNNFVNDYFYIACRGGNSFFSDLNIAAVAIYNRALSSTEISQVYNFFKNRHGV
jgi:hypothetical protein